MKTEDAVIVTGSTGFLGSALTRELLRRGKRVISIGRKERGFLSDEVFNSQYHTLINFDLTEDIGDILSDYTIKTIFHLAAAGQVSNIRHDAFYEGNVKTTSNLLEYARLAHVPHFIYTSTHSVFGEKPNTKYLVEDDVPTPTHYYGLTKYFAELLIKIELRDSDTKGTVIRFPALYGHDHLGGIVYTFYQCASEGQPIEVYGRGEKFRNVLYVDDAVDILIRSMEAEKRLQQYETFFAGSQNSLPAGEIAMYIKKYIHSQSEIVLSSITPTVDFDVYVDITKAKEQLGFQPMTIEEGLKKYLEEMIAV